MMDKIFIVDDDIDIADYIGECLSLEGYDVKRFNDGKELVDYLSLTNDGTFRPEDGSRPRRRIHSPPDLIIIDIYMPLMGAIETSKKLKELHYNIPIIAITGYLKGELYKDLFEQGFCDILEKPFRPDMLLLKVSNAIAQAKIPTYEKITNSLILAISEMGDARDSETQNHNKRLSEMVYLVAKKIGLNEKRADVLRMSSIMHDVGKIYTPDEILKKPGKLTFEEFNIMKMHTTNGASILNKIAIATPIRFMELAKEIALHHHEKLDGSGYPCGLKSDLITLDIRIVTVLDIYDAVTMKRSYHDQRSHEEGIKVLINESKAGKIDTDIVNAFLKLESQIKDIKNKVP